MKIVHKTHYVFGGLKERDKIMLYLIPEIRLVFQDFETEFDFSFCVGILFWEFVFRIIFKK